MLWETHPGSPTILTQFQQNLDCFFCVRLGLKSFLSIQLSIRYPSKNKEKLQMFKLITFLFKTGLLRKKYPKITCILSSLHPIPSCCTHRIHGTGIFTYMKSIKLSIKAFMLGIHTTSSHGDSVWEFFSVFPAKKQVTSKSL